MANCRTQHEIDELWAKLSAGGRIDQCGWLTDRFGVSWQIVPANLGELMHRGPEAANRVMEAILGMKKPDMAALERASRGPK